MLEIDTFTQLFEVRVRFELIMLMLKFIEIFCIAYEDNESEMRYNELSVIYNDVPALKQIL